MDPLLTWFSRKQGAGEVGTVNAFKLGFAYLALGLYRVLLLFTSDEVRTLFFRDCRLHGRRRPPVATTTT